MAGRLLASSRAKVRARRLPAPRVRTYPGAVLPCPTCSRHVFAETSACPFCGTVLRAGVAPPTVLGLVLGVALAGCGGPSSETTGTSDTGGSDSNSSTVSSTSGPTTGVTTSTASSDSSGGSGTATGSSSSATTTSSTTSGSDSDTTDDTTSDATTMDGTSTTTGDTTTLDTTTFDTTTSSTGDSSTGDTTEDTWDTVVLPYAGALPDDGDSL